MSDTTAYATKHDLDVLYRRIIDDSSQNLNDALVKVADNFNGLEKRIDKLEHRMDKLERRMDKLEHRMDKLEGNMERLGNVVAGIQATVEQIEALTRKNYSLLLETVSAVGASRSPK